jgi:hypothetical protein
MNEYDLPLYAMALERFAPTLEAYTGIKPRVPRDPLPKRIVNYLRALSSKF